MKTVSPVPNTPFHQILLKVDRQNFVPKHGFAQFSLLLSIVWLVFSISLRVLGRCLLTTHSFLTNLTVGLAALYAL